MAIQELWQAFMNIPHIYIILILSFISTLITTIIYKYTTDQKRLKEIKTKLKDMREKQKKHKNDTKKLISLQKEMMQLNMEMLKQSFKSMLYTFIPLIVLFAWMSANVAYHPINPEDEFTITAQISTSYSFDLKEINLTIMPEGTVTRNDAHVPRNENRREVQWLVKTPKEGTYTAIIESPTFKETKEILVSNTNKYNAPIKDIKDSQILKIIVGNEPVRPLRPIGLGLNWLWTYILLSVILSIGLRKALRVA